jgi:hypothetical protein
MLIIRENGDFTNYWVVQDQAAGGPVCLPN